MILITAANGNQGKLLVPKLIAAGLPVRACVRSEASAKLLKASGVTEVIVGDITDPAVMARAINGVEKVYYVCPTVHPLEREMGFALIDASRAAGVKHFVFSSVLHAITTDLVQHEIKRDVEEHLLSSGLEFTILQPSNYMLPLKLRPVFEEGVFRLSWSLERRQSLVDLGDVTDVAVAVLCDSERHASATYELVAPGRYTANDLGNIISSVLERDIPTSWAPTAAEWRIRLRTPVPVKWRRAIWKQRAVPASAWPVWRAVFADDGVGPCGAWPADVCCLKPTQGFAL
jgi:uncharacterized protein YbjT (DUF2867 family)